MNFDEVVKLMDDRGYSVHHHSSDKTSICFIKQFEFFDIVIFADVNLNSNVLELSYITNDMHFTLSTGNFAIKHPEFKAYERKLYFKILRLEDFQYVN